MKIEKIYRQGDVILFKLIEENNYISIEKKSELILEIGEVTGHAHRLKGEIELLEHVSNDIFFNRLGDSKEILFKVLEQPALLTHEEHDVIILEKGIYLKIQQIEYNPFTDGIRWIMD